MLKGSHLCIHCQVKRAEAELLHLDLKGDWRLPRILFIILVIVTFLA